ncbi:ribonucleotide-diphosphate reductase subunit beta [Persicirhabdus sediminis]|uniref:ribonucleoside-diphosphate reductase n=1 Tax=Persicirhabdus sediminis TaxID=454144 RepID=A0A8J7MB07_9BACT|nr:ribonucleotide-diphosphate reductase subunit beta [Persicirhabdus sediminis]MBK1789681.1 ribonucleotide-diphosphate reductase subunit beta [Persicirhabdus sediminis]
MADIIKVTLGDRVFELDREKAEEGYAAKKVINGRQSMFFNILPLKYTWAYNLYKQMKNDHWEPAEVNLTQDAVAWKQLPAEAQKLVKMALGSFALSQNIFASQGIYVLRDLVTAPELKLVFGRYVHEENTRSDVLVYLYGSLGLDPLECQDLASASGHHRQVEEFAQQNISQLTRNSDTKELANKQAFARNLFLYNQCLEGTQFFSQWACLFSLASQNKLPGVGQILSKLLQDVLYRIELFNQLLKELVSENPELWTEEFQAELVDIMKQAVELEQQLISQLPVDKVGLQAEALSQYIEHLADERLSACGLARQYFHHSSPLPWLDEQIHINTGTRVAPVQTAVLDAFDDDDL